MAARQGPVALGRLQIERPPVGKEQRRNAETFKAILGARSFLAVRARSNQQNKNTASFVSKIDFVNVHSSPNSDIIPS